ncbi:MAG: hypothetical protein D6801_00610 [Alphaproteobacteria bacterium]|nr:MAG: hypothetical protein D6801_00610 [Alphaproteobacteria bacterium]
MSYSQKIRYLLLLIFVIVAPTVAMIAGYHFTNNPLLRPLAITKQALQEFGIGDQSLVIIADVTWVDGKNGGLTKFKLADSITRAFAAKGITDVWVRFHPGKGVSQVTYRIGGSELGPFPVSRAVAGVEPASQALRMH